MRRPRLSGLQQLSPVGVEGGRGGRWEGERVGGMGVGRWEGGRGGSVKGVG